MKTTIPLLSLVLITGCMSSVTPAGPNTYYLSKGSLPIWMSAANAQADCYEQANTWCAKRGLVMVPVTSNADPSRFGHAGSAAITFRALKPGDPAITNTPAK